MTQVSGTSSPESRSSRMNSRRTSFLGRAVSVMRPSFSSASRSKRSESPATSPETSAKKNPAASVLGRRFSEVPLLVVTLTRSGRTSTVAGKGFSIAQRIRSPGTAS